MKDSLLILQSIVPELVGTLENRLHILSIIERHGPIGRRTLAEQIGFSERTIRTETDLLKQLGLLESAKSGMYLTALGKKSYHAAEKVMEQFVRMNDREEALAQKLGFQFCRIVQGNVDEDSSLLIRLGQEAAQLLDELLPEGDNVVAVTGGSTMAALAQVLTPELSKHREFTFVPARGGLGEVMSIQANTVSDRMAQATNGTNTALFVPDNLSVEALQSLKNEPSIRQTIELMKDAKCLLYSIGSATVMMERRKLTDDQTQALIERKAVGEAFGCYYDRNGKIVYRLSRFGLQLEDIATIPYALAIAAGESKAEAIEAFANLAPSQTWLVTDEGAANMILKGVTL